MRRDGQAPKGAVGNVEGDSQSDAVDGGGNGKKASELFPVVYEELRAFARYRLAREDVGHTLPPTALVHEAYLRLAPSGKFANRRQFFHAAAEAMRRILIEHARGKLRVKRGGRPAGADQRARPGRRARF